MKDDKTSKPDRVAGRVIPEVAPLSRQGKPGIQPEIAPYRPIPEVAPHRKGKPEVKPEIRPIPEVAPYRKGKPEVKPEIRPIPEVAPHRKGKPDVVQPRPEIAPQYPRPIPEIAPQRKGKPEVRPEIAPQKKY